MPPTKLRKSSTSYDRMTNTSTLVHYWIKGISRKELFEELNKDNTKPKVKQKIRNELTRRGIKIVKRVITND